MTAHRGLRELLPSAPITVICGHYGAGKTNVAVNLSLLLASGRSENDGKPILCDLDIVNPYFRSSDNADLVRENGVELIMPEYAGSNVDIPSIPGSLKRIFLPGKVSVLDVGGDDSGAVVLKGYAEEIKAAGYCFIYVINESRLYIKDPADACRMLSEIEQSSGLKASAILNNTNLKDETTPETVRRSFRYAAQVCGLCGKELCATTVSDRLADSFNEAEIKENKITFIKDVTKKIY